MGMDTKTLSLFVIVCVSTISQAGVVQQRSTDHVLVRRSSGSQVTLSDLPYLLNAVADLTDAWSSNALQRREEERFEFPDFSGFFDDVINSTSNAIKTAKDIISNWWNGKGDHAREERRTAYKEILSERSQEDILFDEFIDFVKTVAQIREELLASSSVEARAEARGIIDDFTGYVANSTIVSTVSNWLKSFFGSDSAAEERRDGNLRAWEIKEREESDDGSSSDAPDIDDVTITDLIAAALNIIFGPEEQGGGEGDAQQEAPENDNEEDMKRMVLASQLIERSLDVQNEAEGKMKAEVNLGEHNFNF